MYVILCILSHPGMEHCVSQLDHVRLLTVGESPLGNSQSAPAHDAMRSFCRCVRRVPAAGSISVRNESDRKRAALHFRCKFRMNTNSILHI